MKLLLITNQNSIPLNVNLYKGNLNDTNIFNNQLTKLDKDNIYVNLTLFMADVGYDYVHLKKN